MDSRNVFDTSPAEKVEHQNNLHVKCQEKVIISGREMICDWIHVPGETALPAHQAQLVSDNGKHISISW